MSVYGKEFAGLYDAGWGAWTVRVWPFLRKIVATRKPDAQSWLDLCCGTGALLKLVTKAGFSAVGVDLSPHQLKHARKNAPRAKLLRADVREFALARRFDVITCMFDSLNYLTTKRDLLRAFRKARQHLGADALFIFDMNTFEGLRRGWCRTSVGRRPGSLVIMETSFDAARALGRCRITGFLRRGRLFNRFEETHVERGYRPEEIEGLLDRAGLSFRRYDGHSLSRARKSSARLLYLCRRT
jgi:SAM-dependent methyltransferase